MVNPKRPNTRLFFESSLELKCLFFFGVALAVVITMSCVLYFKVTKTQIDTQNPLMGKLLSEREFLLMHLRVLLRKEATTPLSDTESNDLDDFIDSMVSQSTSINEPREKHPFSCRLIRPGNYRTNENDRPNNDFEKRLLQSCMQVPSPEEAVDQPHQIERTEKNGVYHYYQILRMDRSCLNCHRGIMGDSTVDLGSLLGIVQVTIPEPPATKEVTRLWALLLGAAVITAFLALIAFYIVIRMVISRPLRNLRLVSEAISNGDISQRADLHTGDEFEALGGAFNRMLQYLVEVQEKLQRTNKELNRNVDELATRNLQLFEMNRIKSDFMATMSHELRTPLNSILGFSEVLGGIEALSEKQKRYADNISKSGKTLLAMINNILDLAKIEAGRLEFQLSRFQIGSIVHAQCDMAKPLADKKNLDIVPEIQTDLPEMRQDAERIQQILNNLLSNAIKFTPEGGRIVVDVRKILHEPCVLHGLGSAIQTGLIAEGSEPDRIDFLQMQVIDTGVGIPREDLQVIFDKFRQASPSGHDDAMTREFTGSGLGLSIVKELCRLLEGDISVESQPGFGSTFTVILPWELNPPGRTESPMQTEIQKFAQAGTRKQPSINTENN